MDVAKRGDVSFLARDDGEKVPMIRKYGSRSLSRVDSG